MALPESLGTGEVWFENLRVCCYSNRLRSSEVHGKECINYRELLADLHFFLPALNDYIDRTLPDSRKRELILSRWFGWAMEVCDFRLLSVHAGPLAEITQAVKRVGGLLG